MCSLRNSEVPDPIQYHSITLEREREGRISFEQNGIK